MLTGAGRSPGVNWDILGVNWDVLGAKLKRQKTGTPVLVYTGN